MKHTLLSTASSLVLSALVVAVIPASASATTMVDTGDAGEINPTNTYQPIKKPAPQPLPIEPVTPDTRTLKPIVAKPIAPVKVVRKVAYLSKDGNTFYDRNGNAYLKDGDIFYDHSGKKNNLTLDKYGRIKDAKGRVYGSVKPPRTTPIKPVAKKNPDVSYGHDDPIIGLTKTPASPITKLPPVAEKKPVAETFPVERPEVLTAAGTTKPVATKPAVTVATDGRSLVDASGARYVRDDDGQAGALYHATDGSGKTLRISKTGIVNGDGSLYTTTVNKPVEPVATKYPVTDKAPVAKSPFQIDANGRVTDLGLYMFTYNAKTGEFFDGDTKITNPNQQAEFKKIVAQAVKPITTLPPVAEKKPVAETFPVEPPAALTIVGSPKPAITKPAVTVAADGQSLVDANGARYVRDDDGQAGALYWAADGSGKTLRISNNGVVNRDGSLYTTTVNKPVEPVAAKSPFQIDANGRVTDLGMYMFTYNAKTGEFFDGDTKITNPNQQAEFKKIVAQAVKPIVTLPPVAEKKPVAETFPVEPPAVLTVSDAPKPAAPKPPVTVAADGQSLVDASGQRYVRDDDGDPGALYHAADGSGKTLRINKNGIFNADGSAYAPTIAALPPVAGKEPTGGLQTTGRFSEDGNKFYDAKGNVYYVDGDVLYDHDSGKKNNLTIGQDGIIRDAKGVVYGNMPAKLSPVVSNQPTPVTISLPAEGKIKQLADGYTVDSQGIIRNSNGAIIAHVKDDGSFTDAKGGAVSKAESLGITQLFSQQPLEHVEDSKLTANDLHTKPAVSNTIIPANVGFRPNQTRPTAPQALQLFFGHNFDVKFSELTIGDNPAPAKALRYDWERMYTALDKNNFKAVEGWRQRIEDTLQGKQGTPYAGRDFISYNPPPEFWVAILTEEATGKVTPARVVTDDAAIAGTPSTKPTTLPAAGTGSGTGTYSVVNGVEFFTDAAGKKYSKDSGPIDGTYLYYAQDGSGNNLSIGADGTLRDASGKVYGKVPVTTPPDTTLGVPQPNQKVERQLANGVWLDSNGYFHESNASSDFVFGRYDSKTGLFYDATGNLANPDKTALFKSMLANTAP